MKKLFLSAFVLFALLMNLFAFAPPPKYLGTDYNGDDKSDLAVFDSNTGNWYVKTAASPPKVVTWANQWGWPGAIPVPGDYDGLGGSDLAVFSFYTGHWYIKTVANSTITWANQWGWAGAIPVPGDYDGNGADDLTVFDTAGGYWYIKTVSGTVIAWGNQWGWSGAVPVTGDYDGDDKSDLAVFDSNTGNWYIKSVSGTVITWANQWGWSGAIPVPGDYDGDDKSDLAVFDTNTGNWYIKSASNTVITWANQWGWPGAIPVPGDYDGDGRYDLALFDSNTGNWFIKSVAGGVLHWATQWGWTGAVPVSEDLFPIQTLNLPDVNGSYESRVEHFKILYGKSDAWEAWMIANKDRYEWTFIASRDKPAVINISLEYHPTPSHAPYWTNETAHMSALEAFGEAAFPGYDFAFTFEGNRATSYAYIISAIPENISYSWGKELGLYYETIFHHEFGHTMYLRHHYGYDDPYLPPGETECVMARNSYIWCSACAAALGVPLNAQNATAVSDAMTGVTDYE